MIVSWSGGKDACLALYRSVQAGHKPLALLTMMEADGVTSRAHALPLAVLQQQAAALGLPLMAQAAAKESYREAYVAALLAAKVSGATAVVFGDM